MCASDGNGLRRTCAAAAAAAATWRTRARRRERETRKEGNFRVNRNHLNAHTRARKAESVRTDGWMDRTGCFIFDMPGRECTRCVCGMLSSLGLAPWHELSGVGRETMRQARQRSVGCVSAPHVSICR